MPILEHQAGMPLESQSLHDCRLLRTKCMLHRGRCAPGWPGTTWVLHAQHSTQGWCRNAASPSAAAKRARGKLYWRSVLSVVCCSMCFVLWAYVLYCGLFRPCVRSNFLWCTVACSGHTPEANCKHVPQGSQRACHTIWQHAHATWWQ